jgi:pimeloyl-ACP methyl ester carboxylesterase
VSEETASIVKCPLLVIHGSNDSISPIEHARRIVQAAPNAQLHEVDGGTHVDAHLIDPDGHDKVIADSLRSLVLESDKSGNLDAFAPATIRA